MKLFADLLSDTESLQHCVADTGTYFCLGCITAYTDLSLAESAGRALDVLRGEIIGGIIVHTDVSLADKSYRIFDEM